jgi:DNA-binding ferritin-like protein
MLDLICTLRASQLFLHQAHLLVKGAVFLQDHEFLGSMYSELEGEFDSVSERLIGLGGQDQLNLQSVMAKVVEKLKSCPSTGTKENKDFFKYQLEFEKSICAQVETLCKSGVSQGTIQLLGDIANRSEMRQYKLKQRVA